MHFIAFSKFYHRILLLFVLISLINTTEAQRGYGLVYSENLKGNTTLFGNTLLHIYTKPFFSKAYIDSLKMRDNNRDGNSLYGNDNANMVYIDIDNDGRTFNSSSADLILPAGSNKIKFARLYWGGRASGYDFDKSANRQVKIRKGGVESTRAYTDVTALRIDKMNTQYQAYADITAFVKQNGTGSYTVANVPLSTGVTSDGGNNGGWTIVVVYENMALPYNSVRVYDGFSEIYGDGSATSSAVTLTGLDVPSGTLATSDARMGVMTWEGDANLTGDFLKINYQAFSNALNTKDNPWNGTISDNGVHVTTKYPHYTNNMGLDIDMFDVGTGYNIEPNATTITLEFGTESDKYFPGLFTFAIRMKDPSITISTVVTDENNNYQAEPGEALTYTIKGSNVGVGNANFIEILDTLPTTVTYIPNSLEIISAPGVALGLKTDVMSDDVAEFVSSGGREVVRFRIGRGADAFRGGYLAAGESYSVRFKVRVKVPVAGARLTSIMNIARIHAKSDANERFINEGTAILNPLAAPLPVTLAKFTANLVAGGRVQLNWTTALEINNSHFIVERSEDGRPFKGITRISGSGTTAKANSYFALDDVRTGSLVLYYRLKQVDFDGKENISEVVAVKLSKEIQVVSVSPNPFVNSMTVRMEWSNTEQITARLINMLGKEVYSKPVTIYKGMNTLKIDNIGSLPSGQYILQLVSKAESVSYKVTK